MCGFLGEYLFNNTLPTSNKIFEDLLLLSKHRGPDFTKIVNYKNFQLGFNRLAILDLSELGNQPMLSPSKRYQLVINGEIYNYKELQEKYKIINLQSTSDTEVVVHLIDLLGIEKTIQELNGMFAISVFDSELNELILARDFAGVKPLFFGISDYGVVFASQFNQITKHPFFNLDLKLRKDVVKEYFGLGYMQAPNTIYEQIFQVEPGELLKVSLDGSIKKQQLKTFFSEFKEDLSVKEKDVAAYVTVLKVVIQRQLLSDVPLATFLSGGIDSPLITAIAKEEASTIEAFTFGVRSKKLDESEKAAAYAAHIKVKQTIERVEELDLLKSVDAHFKFLSEPFGDYSSIPTYLISKKAKKKHTVMLSGDGGDELFFGYPRMLDVIKKRYWFYIPHSIRKPLVRLAIKLNLTNSWGPYSYQKIEDWIVSKHLHITPSSLKKIIPNTPFSKELDQLYHMPNRQHKKSLLHWLRWNEFYGHLQRVLIKVDRMSMANSLEVRVPFLDKESIEFAWSTLPKMKKNVFVLKEFLRDAMKLQYSEELVSKDKKGFAVPIEDWLLNELKTDLKKVIFETPFYGEGIIDVEEVKLYITDYLENKHSESWGVWHIYAWQKWALTEKLTSIDE
jgi:asparagine synthase (glutamine-hydrolysing)